MNHFHFKGKKGLLEERGLVLTRQNPKTSIQILFQKRGHLHCQEEKLSLIPLGVTTLPLSYK